MRWGIPRREDIPDSRPMEQVREFRLNRWKSNPEWRFRPWATARELHRDQRGVTSLMSLVAVLVFTMLLVMLTNIVRHVDDKVRMQNAADAAAYSGTAQLARGMNSIAFANHLESETLALTALCRALADRASPSAQQLLPILQTILGTAENVDPSAVDHLLPNYQRDVMRLMPGVAAESTTEIALRYGLPQGTLTGGQARTNPSTLTGRRGPQWGALWRMTGSAVSTNDEMDPSQRTLPVIDPNLDGRDFPMLTDGGGIQATASIRRLEAATQALRRFFDALPEARRQDRSLLGDTTKQLTHLLEIEYPHTNLPMMLRSGNGRSATAPQDYSFVAVAYQTFEREHGPKLFVNPLASRSDAQTFAQAEMFLPRGRYRCCPWVIETEVGPVNNVDPWPGDWDSFNQTWSVRLVPADPTAALAVLTATPPAPVANSRPIQLPGVTPAEIGRINTH